MMDERERTFWLGVRQALLLFVDHIERLLGVVPSTAEIRQAHKETRRSANGL